MFGPRKTLKYCYYQLHSLSMQRQEFISELQVCMTYSPLTVTDMFEVSSSYKTCH